MGGFFWVFAGRWGDPVMCWTEREAEDVAHRILDEDPSVRRVEIRFVGNLLRVIERGVDG
jgi:hypothetical protein